MFFKRSNKVLRFANTWAEDVQEVGNNLGFTDAEFQDLMQQYGDFRSGEPWCMSFVKMVWTYKTKRKLQADLDRLMTPSTQGTYENFQKDTSGKFIVSKKPKRGSIVIWQQYVNGTPQYKGHAGIVTRVGKKHFYTIEGNTNSDGSREGYTVSKKKREYKWNVTNGLRLRGFITIKNLKI